MALLSNLLRVNPNIMTELAVLYGPEFPMEIRYYLSDFLESRLIGTSDQISNQSPFDDEAAIFMDDFVKTLEATACSLSEVYLIPTKLRLEEAARTMRTKNPSTVYMHLKSCMLREQQLAPAYDPQVNHAVTITQRIDQLNSCVFKIEEEIKEIVRKSESFKCEYHDLNMDACMDDSNGTSGPSIMARQLRNESLDYLRNQIIREFNALPEKIIFNVKSTDNLTVNVVDEYLNHWNWYQKRDVNEADLNCIQNWCVKLAESAWQTREQIKFVLNFQTQLKCELDQAMVHNLQEFYTLISNILEKLIKGSFIVEQQPPQVMKTNSKFSVTVRLLVANALGIGRVNSPKVKVSIIAEAQAQRIAQNLSLTSKNPCGNILNGERNMEYSSNQMSAPFTNLKLDGFKRPGKKAAENVADEKFALLFETAFAVGDMSFKLQVMSVPIVVIVHGSQEVQAYATIFWDNSFAELNRSPFAIPDKVSWAQFSQALSQYFSFKDKVYRELTPENLHCLAEKLFKMQFPNGVVPNDLTVTWAAFCKEHLPDRQFSFWEWFFAAMRITNDHFPSLWGAGLIFGFISKKRVEEYLLGCQFHGTFILRFSDSELGSISIAWLRVNGKQTVLHIQPFNANDLKTRSLVDRLTDLEELKILYPNMIKSDAFKNCPSDNRQQPRTTSGQPGYVPATMRLVVFPTEDNLESNLFGNLEDSLSDILSGMSNNELA